MRGLVAFKEAYLASDAAHEDTYGSVEARQLRYQIYWAFYENSAYRRIHNWSTAYRHQYALYKYIRNLYCPAARIGNFYAAHLFGGPLDHDAGDEGAIPIETENEAIRPAIATLWQQSNLAVLKDVIALRGSIEGDVVLRVVDDPNREKVYIERVDPWIVVDLTLDAFGNVKGYVIEEQRADPNSKTRTVTYREVVTREGDLVVFETYKNNSLYGWYGQPATWSIPYTFVPMVLVKHSDIGLAWGVSELHSGLSKIHEVDDMASMLSDQIRKYVDPVWLMKGMPNTTLTVTGATRDETGATNTRPEPGREEMKTIWKVPVDAKAEPLLANLNIKDALQHVDSLLKELERDYPELRVDLHATSGTSGRALRIARQEVSSKVRQRREGYDTGLVKLHQMAITIGGWRGYPGYEGFNLDSYTRGDLNHRIAARPVFEADPLDDIEVSQAFWNAAETAVKTGADLVGYLKAQGWSNEQVSEVAEGWEIRRAAQPRLGGLH